MNKLKAFLIITTMFCAGALKTNAAPIDSLIQKSQHNKTSTIAVSVKDTKTGKTIYKYNENKLLNPASAQKVFTMRSAYNQLGGNYTFKTTAFTDKKGNLYIKLSGDPSLTTASLKNLLLQVKENYKGSIADVVIDPMIIDNKQWGTGWMWDDDTNAYLPKYSPFAINENKIEISIEPGRNGSNPEIKNKSPYSMTLVNFLKNGNTDNVKFERTPWETGDLTNVTGTVKNPVKVKLTVDSPERHLLNILGTTMSGARLKYTGAIKVAPLPQGLEKVAEISSAPLSDLTAITLKNSNNFYSEMIFKTAAAEHLKKQGTTAAALELFDRYYSDVKSDKPVIADACGISRNDLISADWMTEALNKIANEPDFEEFVILLPKPIEGTLSDRLLDVSLKLRAKTGTASGISSIIGYIETKSGKNYSFAVMIENFTAPTVEIKRIEDDIIREIYKM